MADLWYYTSDGQQKEPVTKDELRQLAERGLLKATDLVWTEGMSKWLKAGKVEGVMPDPALARSAFRTTSQARPEAAVPLAAELPAAAPDRAERTRGSRPRDDADDRSFDDPDERPRQRRQRERWEDDEDDFDDERPRRRRQKSGSGARVALILGSIAGVVLLIGVVIAIVVMVSGGSGEGTRSFSLRTNEKANFNVRFTKGKTVEIWVTSNDISDVDVFVFDARNVRVAFDDRPDKDCYVRFVPAATQSFRIEVWNRMVVGFGAQGRNRHNSGTMRFKESDHAVGGPPPNQDFQVQPPVFAQPPNGAPPVVGGGNVGAPHGGGFPPVVPIIIPGGVQPPVTRPPIVRPNPIVRPPVIRPIPRPGRFR